MIRKRILQYLELKGVSKYKFYQITGLSNGFLDKEGSIGSDKCEKICYEYNDISVVWLITGKGPMLKEDVKNENQPNSINYKEIAEARLEIIEGLKFKIAALEKQLLESKYTQKETFLYSSVADPAPELIKKTSK